jgi:ATP-dependent Clp protease ATP-binding subunit ClpA
VAERVDGYLDAVVPFTDLAGGGASPAGDLLRDRMDAFVQAMDEEYQVEVEVSDDVREHIVDRASDLSDANAIEELISERLYGPMTDLLLADEVTEAARIVWDGEQEEIRVKSGRKSSDAESEG